MNPPYNATKKCCNPEYIKTWKSNSKEDPSKGLHFVEWVAQCAPSTCKIAVLLPMQAAIGNKGDTKKYKKKLLEKYTLEAVFSLPNDMFYPGASTVTCCMIFDLSQKHEKADKDTFFGYFKKDNFIKRKGLDRVEQTDEDGNSLWQQTEKLWLDTYKNKRAIPGLSVMHRVTWEDEWLAETYTEKNWSELSKKDFQTSIDLYLSYMIAKGAINEIDKNWMNDYNNSLHTDYRIKPHKNVNMNFKVAKWKDLQIEKMFKIQPIKDYKGMSNDNLDDDGKTPFIANSAMNNAIRGFSSIAQTEEGNIITFSDTTDGNTFFYQPDPFIGFAHVQGMHSLGHAWSEKELLFLTTILTFANRNLFDYGRKIRRDTIANSKIKLPAQKCEGNYVIDESKSFSEEGYIPDWEWMDSYIKSLPYSDRI